MSSDTPLNLQRLMFLQIQTRRQATLHHRRTRIRNRCGSCTIYRRPRWPRIVERGEERRRRLCTNGHGQPTLRRRKECRFQLSRYQGPDLTFTFTSLHFQCSLCSISYLFSYCKEATEPRRCLLEDKALRLSVWQIFCLQCLWLLLAWCSRG